MSGSEIDLLKACVLDVPDFPKPGIVFKDITPLLANPRAFETCLDLFVNTWCSESIDAVVGIESRGFIFGAALASRLRAGFIPARKPGKLPRDVMRASYALEYGTDAIEIHADALRGGDRVLIVDDVIATGGTAAAALELVRRRSAEVVGLAVVIELLALSGREKLPGVPVRAVLTY
jgi:adenine phosphoribosyltransferase